MHLQMDIHRSIEEQLEQLLKELRLEHIEEEVELKKLLHRCTASARPTDIDAYEIKAKAHRNQGAKLTITNVLRVVLELGLTHPELKRSAKKSLLELLNKVGVARGYGHGKAV